MPLSPDDSVLIQGPPFHVDLAPLDALHPIHYTARLLLFRCTSSAQRDAQLVAFKIGLRALVSRCPILGGTVVPLPPGEAKNGNEDWRTIVPGPGVEMVVRDFTSDVLSFDELEAADFSIQHLPRHLLVPVPQNLGNEPFAACKVQFTAIAGGTIVTFTKSHSVADGSGTNELMRILSEETRLAQQHSNVKAYRTDAAADTGLNRSILRNITSSVPFSIADNPAYLSSSPPSRGQKLPHPFDATSPELRVLFHISVEGVARLKADASTSGGPPISTHDAISALIWRSVLLVRSRRAQAATDSTLSRIFMPSDARRHLGLPVSYVGNAVYQLTAALDLDTLLSPQGLQRAAGAIRQAITNVKPELVVSYMAELKRRWVDWGFLIGTSTVNVAMGTDWTSGVLYNYDWGESFGPMVRYRHPGVEGTFNCIFPKLPDGSAEVVIGLMPDEVEMLRSGECLGKYLQQP